MRVFGMLAKETKRKRGQNNGQISISAKIFLSLLPTLHCARTPKLVESPNTNVYESLKLITKSRFVKCAL